MATATTHDAVIRLWDVASGEQVGRLVGHDDQIYDLDFSPDGRLLASAGRDTDVGVWLVDPRDAVEQICADLADARQPGLGSLGC